ncbi:MAG: DUF2088 domain-containing protein, partial [Lachnospiraceae bacterium]|nr:DUF2088 domain-containing protein [Lachnospiraceae bacterium]
MKQFTFRYGDGCVRAELDEKNILGILAGHAVPAVKDIPKALSEALDNPIDSLPLAEYVSPSDRICL